MRIRTAALAASVAVSFVAPPVQADPITIVQDQRFVMSDAFVFNDLGFAGAFAREQHQGSEARDATAQASFGNTVSRAESRLDSSISTALARFTGSGTATGVVDGRSGLAQASSRFELLFNVNEGRAFDFSAMFDALGGSWQAHLIESPGDFARQSLRFSFISNIGGLTQEVSRHGFLNPGRYGFAIRSDAAGDTEFANRPTGRSAFNFAFNMSPVPEPASLLLVGSGVAGLLGGAGRRARRRSLESSSVS